MNSSFFLHMRSQLLLLLLILLVIVNLLWHAAMLNQRRYLYVFVACLIK